ncbi:MAG: YceI family protein [Pseudomonadota bacterium]
MNALNLLPLALVAFLAGCGQPAPEAQAPAGDAAEAAAVDLKAPAGVYKLDTTHAAMLWSVPHNGISNYTARFTRLEATLTLDPGNLENSRIEAAIDPTSVSTGYPGDYKAGHPDTGFDSFDEDIAQAEHFLNAGRHPQITFTSTSVAQTGPRTADVTGDLTFLGVTRPVTLKARFNGEIEKHPFLGVPAIGFAAEGAIKRSDFGMPVGPVGDEVTLSFDGEFVHAPAAAAAAD